ncbi:type II secretion system F family protein [archaeon]|jgi:archaeal flagellar protein FlaJ|nr:type II secretion system F family protein [Candidatus Woesearchaeota archaeon]MBT4166063.1 type II secretion system F family protein [archaeon]
MKFRIPFTFTQAYKLKKRSKLFISKIRPKKKSKLNIYLKNADNNLTREEYIGICRRNFVINIIFLYLISTTILFMFNIKKFFLFGILIAFIFSGFLFFSQINYPRIYVSRKQKNIEKNLLPALEDILVQLNSGITLFNIMANISSSDYGVLSDEFKIAVRRINSGEPDSIVLDELGEKNSSLFFRRTLWQMSNGIVAGSDMAVVIKDSIKTLNEEQLIQIQDYGSKLNPLIVMYMLITVIIPTLSVAFLTIISSMVNISKTMTPLLFITLFLFVILAQIMFLGLIKSKRPSLL